MIVPPCDEYENSADLLHQSTHFSSFHEDVEPHENTAFPFSGGETSGLDRVKKYIWDTHHVDTYKETRNDLIGPEYSTKFSPW